MAPQPFGRCIFAGLSRHIFLYFALALLPAMAFAQAAPEGYQAKLYAVTQSGSHIYSSQQVAALSGLQLGANIDRNTIQTAADRLARSGLFSSVRYQFSTDANGLTVTFQVEDAPAFPISLDNMPWLTEDDVSKALNQVGAPIERTAPASGAIDDQIADALRKALEAKGIHVTITHSVAPVPGADGSVVQFKAAGADLRVASLEFTDPLAAHDPAIQSELSAIVGKPLSIEAVQNFDFKQVRPAYLSHSYLRVKFAPPAVRFATPSTVAVTISIDAGPAYAWGGVTWTGNSSYTTSDLDALVKGTGLAPGAPADGNKILTIWQSVRAAYGHRGYIDATVTPKENFDDAAHRASFDVNISEGLQYHMGNLVLTGVAIEAERRLRAAWHIAQGQPFDQTFCDYFLSQGIADALKGLPAAQDKVGHFLQKNPQQKTVDVMVDFE